MELRITNPQENWLTEQILWNNEELKAAIAEKVKDYKTIAYTEDSLKDMKADRADLNKLKKAFEDERKRVKKICMEPYTKFEQQVKEITALIDEPIGLIDSQIREIDERRKTVKREEIEELFTSIGFQSFVKLDMIWDEKWLNATVSIVNAALLGEALNLSPSPQLGQFYMVPFDNKKKGCKEAQFQLGYKGYIQLAIRSGYYKKLNVLAIKEGELVRYDPLDEEVEVNLIDDDILREEAPTMGYFAMFEYENGFRKTLYWSKKKMLAHAEKYSFAFYKNGGAKSLELLEQGKIPEKDMWKYSSFWFKDFDGMALKTMLRQLISKWGIMSIDLQNAIDKDMAVIHEDGKTEYVDAVKAEDDGVVADQELNEVQEDQPAEPGTQQPDPKGIEASFFG